MADKCECQKLRDACKTWPSDFFIKLCHMQNWVNLKAKGAHTKYWLFICLVRYLYLFVGFVCFVSFSLFFTFHSRNFIIWNFFTISKSYGITLCIYFYVLYSIVTLLFSLSFFFFSFSRPWIYWLLSDTGNVSLCYLSTSETKQSWLFFLLLQN